MFRVALYFACLALSSASAIVINEIHYDPKDGSEALEFVELHNPTDKDVNLDKWSLDDGVRFSFVTGAVLPAKGFLVIGGDPAAIKTVFGVDALGPWKGKLSNSGETIILRDAGGAIADQVAYQAGFPWPSAAKGDGGSMELIHPDVDNSLPGAWRSASDTLSPGKGNMAFTEKDLPQFVSVRHSPAQAKPNEPVSIHIGFAEGTLKPTEVNVDYQVVKPGDYIRQSDPAYEVAWESVPAMPEGGGFRAIIPGIVNQHRHLIRYRVTATMKENVTLTVPYADDEQPNFAYFCHAGVGAWTGPATLGAPDAITFPAETMNLLPVYHLLATAEDVERCQYSRRYNEDRFLGTLVYDGAVYDHIEFKIRGEVSTYKSGKNKWRFYFRRTHDFQGRDAAGKRYPEPFKKLNLNACASPHVAANRGMAGLDEAVPLKLYELAGVPAPKAHHIQFRVIDDAEETPKSPYNGDLWGLYLVVEHPDKRFLGARELPAGNVYNLSMVDGLEQRFELPNQTERPGRDWYAFAAKAQRGADLPWWRANVNWPAYHRFAGINAAVSNVDLRIDANYVAYHQLDGPWTIIPWDLDMMYVPMTHWPGVTLIHEAYYQQKTLAMELGNHARELLDLLFSDRSRFGGQAAQVVEEIRERLHPESDRFGFEDVDMALWNEHPLTSDAHYQAFYALHASNRNMGGYWRRTLKSADLDGFADYMIDFMTDTDTDGWSLGDGDQNGYGYEHLKSLADDPDIPGTPVIEKVGDRRFTSARYRGKASLKAIHWRLGEIDNPRQPNWMEGNPWQYEIQTVWESHSVDNTDVTIPEGKMLEGHRYRVRARFEDESGRWSHWSAPHEFGG